MMNYFSSTKYLRQVKLLFLPHVLLRCFAVVWLPRMAMYAQAEVLVLYLISAIVRLLHFMLVLGVK
jgi:hypothetical protein